MKILEKIKKVFLSIGVFLVTLPTKIWAVNMENFANHALEMQPEYGVIEPIPIPRTYTILENIGKIISIIIIPLIFIIGIIIYLKKSKSSKLRKVISVLVAAGISIFLCFVVNKIIELFIEMY